MSTDAAGLALAVAAGVHLGFQLTVTALVYPALAEVPEERWTTAHARHSRRITPVVGLVYTALLATLAWALADAVTGWRVVTAMGVGAVLSTTAFAAAPTHGRLGRPDLGDDRRQRLLHRLLTVDVVRLLAAAATAGAAVLAYFSGS